jgi:hypothetical protein
VLCADLVDLRCRQKWLLGCWSLLHLVSDGPHPRAHLADELPLGPIKPPGIRWNGAWGWGNDGGSWELKSQKILNQHQILPMRGVVEHFWCGCGDEVVGRAASSDPTTALHVARLLQVEEGWQPLVSVMTIHDQHLPLKILSASCPPKTMGPQPPREGISITRSCISQAMSSWRQIGGDLTRQSGFTTSNDEYFNNLFSPCCGFNSLGQWTSCPL